MRARTVTRTVTAGSVRFGRGLPLAIIAGPCVIESRRHCVGLAGRLARLAAEQGQPFVFKASFDKANRTSIAAYRGPGLVEGLDILREVKERHGVPVLTDVHETAQVEAVAGVVDVLQIPAFLCRQTDLLVAAGASGCVVNVKKAQFLSPWDMQHVLAKIASTGNHRILVTERGSTFGYNNLVVDMRSLLVLRTFGYPVIFDATHSLQRPGGQGDRSGGDAQWAPDLARGAVAVGCEGVFMETHERPARALSDGANLLPLARLARLWPQLRALHTLERGA